MKKRIITLLLAVTLLMTLAFPLTASAAESGVEVTVGSLSAKQGDEIVVPVTIDKNSGIWGFNWKLYYDSQVLRFDSIEFSTEGDFSKLDFLPTDDAKYPVIVQGTGNSVTENVTVTGVAAKIHFKVYVGVALGKTEVELRLDDPGNNIDVDSNEVPLVCHKGVITISEGLVSSDNPEDYPPEKPLEEPERNPGYVNQNKEPGDGNGIPWVLIIVGVVVLIGVVVVVWLFSGSDDDDDDDEDDKTPGKRKAKAKKDAESTIPLNEEVPAAKDEKE